MKRKLLIFLFAFLILFSALNIPDVSAQITNCTVTRANSIRQSQGGPAVPADTSDTEIAVTLKDTGGVITEDVSVYIRYKNGDAAPVNQGGNLAVIKPSNFDIDMDKLTIGGRTYIYRGGASEVTFQEGTYTVIVVPAGRKSNENVLCTASFNVAIENYCSVELDPANTFKPQDKVRFRVIFYKTPQQDNTVNPEHDHRVKLKRQDGDGEPVNISLKTRELREWQSIPREDNTIPTGKYKIEIFKNAGSIIFEDERLACKSEQINIDPNGGSIGCTEDKDCPDGRCLGPDDKGIRKCEVDEDYIPGQIPLACTEKKDADGNGTGKFVCNTAVGKINTDPANFAKSVLTLFLSIAGGILLLLLIINGYKLMVSQGDPEKLKEAREGIIAAIAGILLIIFSLVLLSFITVNVLGLPGFNP